MHQLQLHLHVPESGVVGRRPSSAGICQHPEAAEEAEASTSQPTRPQRAPLGPGACHPEVRAKDPVLQLLLLLLQP